MEKFLAQPEATFYHVTTWENWQEIQKGGLQPKDGRIFVSRVGEFPVLIAIALEQLPDIYKAESVVFLKIPQSKNAFTAAEIIPDNQAIEWPQPFQNIILRKSIPIDNIEFMMKLDLGAGAAKEFLFTRLNSIAMGAGMTYPTHSIYKTAGEVKYVEQRND